MGDIATAFANAFADTDSFGVEKDFSKTDGRNLGIIVENKLTEETNLRLQVRDGLAALTVLTQSTADAVAAEATARDLDVNNEQLRAGAVEAALAVQVASRPGDSPAGFTQSLTGGDPAALAPLPGALVAFGSGGFTARLTGAGIVARRDLVRLEPGRTYDVRLVVQRRVDTVDPSNDAVRMAVAFYDEARTLIGYSAPTDIMDLVVANARTETVLTVGPAATGVLVPPTGARYMRAYVQTFGVSSTTDVEVIAVRDITGLAVYAPNLTAFSASVAALLSIDAGTRLGVLETAVGTPVNNTFDTRGNFVAASIGATVTTVRTLGYATSGDGGGATYRRVASNPTHAGKAQSADGAYWEMTDRIVTIAMFGPLTTAANQAAALAAMQTYASAKGASIRLDTAIAIGTPADPIDFGPGPILTNNTGSITGHIYVGPDRYPLGRIPIAYADGTVSFSYVMGRKWGRPIEEREDPLSFADIDPVRKVEALDLTMMETSRWPATASDTFTVEAATAASPETLAYTLTNDSNWHVVKVPLVGGQEVSGFMKGSDYARGVFVFTTGGFEYFAAFPNLPGSLGVKLAGAAPSVTAAPPWLGQADHQSYQSQNVEWTIRAVQKRKYAILLNGTEISLVRDLQVPGEIVAVGFGVFGNTSASAYVTQLSRVTRREQTGKCPIHAGIIGNSMSSPNVHGHWQKWMEEELDFACGGRMFGTVNLAVTGTNSSEIYNSIQSNALGNANIVAVVSPESNDIQESGAANLPVTIGNVQPTLQQIKNEGRIPVLVIGYAFYSKVLAGGVQGQNTANYEAGGERRAAMRRLAATMGVEVVDLQQELGPMLATLLATPTLIDPVLRDNIHPTARAYRIMARAIAKGMLRVWAPALSCKVSRAAWPVQGGPYDWRRNGWAGALLYSLSDDGWFALHGTFTAGTATAGTIIGQVPRAYAPIAQETILISTNAGTAILQVGTDGRMALYGLGTETFVRLDGVRWATARAA